MFTTHSDRILNNQCVNNKQTGVVWLRYFLYSIGIGLHPLRRGHTLCPWYIVSVQTSWFILIRIRFCGWWEGWDPVNRFNHASRVAIVTPTDRPKSVRNRCEIEVLVAFFCCHVAFWIFLSV